MDCRTPHCLNEISVKARSPYCYKCKSRRFREKHRVKALYYAIKGNAKRRGIPFFISIDEWIIFCAETNYHNLVGNNSGDMTVDRKKSWLPYTYDNIQMMSRAENTNKRNKEQRDRIKNYPQVLKGDPNIPF